MISKAPISNRSWASNLTQQLKSSARTVQRYETNSMLATCQSQQAFHLKRGTNLWSEYGRKSESFKQIIKQKPNTKIDFDERKLILALGLWRTEVAFSYPPYCNLHATMVAVTTSTPAPVSPIRSTKSCYHRTTWRTQVNDKPGGSLINCKQLNNV